MTKDMKRNIGKMYLFWAAPHLELKHPLQGILALDVDRVQMFVVGDTAYPGTVIQEISKVDVKALSEIELRHFRENPDSSLRSE